MEKSLFPEIIAHRGYSGRYPENTLIAFQRAIDVGADMIELDIALTADKIPVVLHDPDVDRTSSLVGGIRFLKMRELDKIDFGSWFHSDYKFQKLPTLEEVLDLVSQSSLELNIEIKSEAHEPRVSDSNIEWQCLELVKNQSMQSRTVISSFNWKVLKRIRNIERECRIGVLAEGKKTETFRSAYDFASEVEAEALHIPKNWANRKTIDQIHAGKKLVRVFTANTAKEIRKLVELGVDGIYTNFAERMIGVKLEMEFRKEGIIWK